MVSIVFAGCKKDTSRDNPVSIPKDVKPFTVDPAIQEKMKGESDTITVLLPGYTADDKASNANIMADLFTQATGKKVQFVTATWDTADWQGKLLASIASNTPYDGFYTSNADYPLMYTKKYVQPITDYVPIDKDLMNIQAMDTFFKYNDAYYLAVAKDGVSPYIMFYNKTMISENGLDDPYQLYKEGKWTFDKMAKMANEVTKDTDGDGINNIWGLATYYPSAFLGMNYTSAMTFDSNGKFKTNLDSPALIHALEMVEKAYSTDGFAGGGGSNVEAAFMQGTHLFMLDVEWGYSTIMNGSKDKPLGFEWGYVPMPNGPDNPDGYTQTSCGGYSIVNGTKNPYTMGAFISMNIYYSSNPIETPTYEVPKEYTDLCDKLVQKPFYSLYYDSIVKGASDILGVAMGGGNIATGIENVRPSYEATAEDANKEMVIPKRTNYEPKTLDFEKDTSGVSVMDTTLPAIGISLVTGSEALDGKSSLKITLDGVKNGTLADAVVTDSNVIPLSGYSQYKISFDYYVAKMADTASYYLVYYDTATGKSYNQVKFKPDTIGSKAHVEIALDPARAENAKLSLILGGDNVDTIVIDNLKIEQVA
jgi:ABC-type glycerol-3-phosphate transport system substrate-binding protein